MSLPSVATEGSGNNIITLEKNRRQFNCAYKESPTNLSMWNRGDFSLLSLSKKQENGDFRNFQMYDKSSLFAINSESLITLKDSTWRFHGLFSYVNGSSKNLMYNLAYELPDNGSPVYYFMEQGGDWDFQKYEFAGSISKQISKKITLGGSFEYIANLHFRTIDTRNELYNFNMKFKTSITWMLTLNKALNFGLDYRRIKEQPNFSNKYQHAGDGTSYNMYINTGLGSYIKNPEWQTEKKDIAYGVTLGYSQYNTKNELHLNYQFMSSSEKTDNLLSNALASSLSKIYQYDYMIHKLSILNNIYISHKELQSGLSLKYISGDGSDYLTQYKTKNFTSSKLNIDFFSNLYLDWGLLKRVGLNVNVENINEKDLKYGQSIDLTNAIISPSVDLNKSILKRSNINLSLYGNYKTNITGDHNVSGAVGNLYTKNIAYHRVSFLTTNSYNLGTELSYSHPIKNGALTYSIGFNYTKPIKINNKLVNDYFTTSDDLKKLNIRILYTF